MFLVITERKIGDNDTIDATFYAVAAEAFESELHDGVEVTHQNEGDVYVLADVAQLLEKEFQRHTVADCLGSGILDDNTVCHGIAERDSDFNHTDSVSLERADYFGRTVQGGSAGAEINGKDVFLVAGEKLINFIHDVEILKG